MGDIHEQVRQIQLHILEDMKKRRDILNRAISDLEHIIDNPPPPINIDFEAIEKEAHEDIEFLNNCEQKRLRRGIK